MKKLVFVLAALLLAGTGCISSSVPQSPVNQPAPSAAPTAILDPHGPEAKADLIKVDSLKPGDTVSSPLTITGQARGTWYFEASFPAQVLDANGNVLVAVPAEAQSDWMTEDFVPFKVTLTFPTPLTANGTIVLKKDNPSGLPEHEDELRIPVRF